MQDEITELEALRTAPLTTASSARVNNPQSDNDTSRSDAPLSEEQISLNNQPSSIASIPDTTVENIVINETLNKIKVSSDIVSDPFVRRLEETVQATNHFHAIHRRVDEFIRSLGISPRIVYTVYYIQIPLGCFLGGLFRGRGSGTRYFCFNVIIVPAFHMEHLLI